MHALRHERQRVRQRERALEHRLRRDAVRDVDDLDLGRDPLHHAVTGADEVVLQPEVRQERDEARHTRGGSLRGPRRPVSSPRRRRRARRRGAAAVVCGPIVTTGTVEPSFAQARAAEARRAGRDRPRAAWAVELDGPVDRAEVRRELVGEQRPGPLGADEEHAPDRVAAAPRAGPPARRDDGTKSAASPCVASASAVASPIAAIRGSSPARRRASSTAPFALVTITQS